MAIGPPPIREGNFHYLWQDWFRQVRDAIQVTADSIPWANINKVGSNLTDIVTRQHDQLQSISGSGTLHLSSSQVALVNSIDNNTYTVATLPTGSLGKRSFVTDATVTLFATAVVGGGANNVPVYYNGTNWMIG